MVSNYNTAAPVKFCCKLSADFVLSDPQEVITEPKDGDPALTCWKGAAILSCLETANELWIKQSEWRSYGSRILREKSLFAL